MLVLAGKKWERICITVAGREVWITVLHTEAAKCRLGFEAPDDVTIDRETVHYARQTHGEAVPVPGANGRTDHPVKSAQG